MDSPLLQVIIFLNLSELINISVWLERIAMESTALSIAKEKTWLPRIEGARFFSEV
jgi:hypothetical protein